MADYKEKVEAKLGALGRHPKEAVGGPKGLGKRKAGGKARGKNLVAQNAK